MLGAKFRFDGPCRQRRWPLTDKGTKAEFGDYLSPNSGMGRAGRHCWTSQQWHPASGTGVPDLRG